MMRPKFSSRTQSAVVCVLLALLTGRGSSQWDTDDCNPELERCYSLLDNSDTCTLWNDTLNCFKAVDQNCPSIGFSAAAGLQLATDAYCSNCATATNSSACMDETPSPPSTPTSAPSPSPPPTTGNCTVLPNTIPLAPLGTPSLTSPPSSSQCTLPDYLTHYRQHCSAFTLSHIRPFGDRDLGLHTCFLPGSWYLLNHQHLTVAVKGRVADGYTYISQVNVTFLPHLCSPGAISYVASTSSLPTSLPNGAYAPFLHLAVENATMATILAPWINTTIVIRRAFGYLTVTIQVPEPLTREREVGGLCSAGCPAFTRVPINLFGNGCPAFTQALATCIDLSEGLPTHNPPYSQICGYDFGKTHDVSLFSLFEAYAGDALLLPDVMGDTMHTEPTSIFQPTIDTTQLRETSSTTQNSIVLQPHTTSPYVARAHTTSGLHLLLSLCLLAAWWLR